MTTKAEDALASVAHADIAAQPASAAGAAHWLANPTSTEVKRKTLLDLWTEQLQQGLEVECPSSK
ncbi:hypothetical protein [Terracidiphilus gabretensis]|uniref:hypothetical protein n=1 Tax=Terracidiphilus gabretensis TaxID=1577687 RepID=UPI00071B7A71|nr:hypothetical protein [Terracidiphilus gabretensis]